MLKNIELIPGFLPSLARMESRSGWEAWPFSGFDTLTIWGVLAKAVFVAIIFMGLAYLMRYLFRPGGLLRGEGWETMEEARTRQNAEQQDAERSAADKTGEGRNADSEKSDSKKP